MRRKKSRVKFCHSCRGHMYVLYVFTIGWFFYVRNRPKYKEIPHILPLECHQPVIAEGKGHKKKTPKPLP